MPVDKESVVAITAFNGLRTDTPPSKCPANYSPACTDMVFGVGEMGTRHPFLTVETFPAEIVWEDKFTARNGTLQKMALDVNGTLYASQDGGAYAVIDGVTPGSKCSSIAAYGRMYMAFFNDLGGSDAPRQWDGVKIRRVSQGGPGAPPTVVNYTLPQVPLVTATSGSSKTITTATPSDPETIQIGGDEFPDGGYNPPQYETFYTNLLIATSTAHGLSVGNVVVITGNTLYNFASAYVSAVVDSTHFKVSYQTPASTAGTGGTVTAQSPLLSRTGNTVTAFTAVPHNLRQGYLARIESVADQSYTLTSIVIDNETKNGLATFTTPTAHGLLQGQTIGVTGVPDANIGGSVVSGNVTDHVGTVVMASAHGLQVGVTVLISTNGGPPYPQVVTSIPTSTSLTWDSTQANVPITSGYVHLPWPLESGATLQIISTPTPTTFEVSFSFSNGSWFGGNITFAWNGTFYVTAVPSATEFQYQQPGPDALIQSGTGAVTPVGQIAAGDHQVYQHFITDTGLITAPSPGFKFTASGFSYGLVQNLAIGPANVIARVLSFTPANGSRAFMLLVPGRVNGIRVSTSTRVDDNVTTSVLVDFSDRTLQAANAIDIQGNNLFALKTLNLPRGTSWYGDRMWWLGEKNTVLGFVNPGMDGGTLSGQTLPLGWTAVGTPVVTQPGFMPVLQVTGPDTGEITQQAAIDARGAIILQPNLRYSFRFWMDGAGSKAGSMIFTVSSVSTAFTSTATFNLSGLTTSGYYTVTLNNVMPASIPPDLQLSIKFAGLAGTASYRDVQPIYADNPNRNPIADVSYVQNPEQYDALTCNIGPNNDQTELRSLFTLNQSIYFITEYGLYWTQQITNTEPSSWYVDRLADRCGSFSQNSVTKGKGWAAWAGDLGAFWYGGNGVERVSTIIAPTWRQIAKVICVQDDPDFERVYFAVIGNDGTRAMFVYDYHEVPLGGPGKWCPWNRQVNWINFASIGAKFAIGTSTYELSADPGMDDQTLGSISGSYVLQPIGSSMLQKHYGYSGLEIDGAGVMTPFVYTVDLIDTTMTLRGQELSTLIDTVAEWPVDTRGRRMWMKLGQQDVWFKARNATFVFIADPNAPVSGVR